MFLREHDLASVVRQVFGRTRRRRRYAPLSEHAPESRGGAVMTRDERKAFLDAMSKLRALFRDPEAGRVARAAYTRLWWFLQSQN